MGFLVPLITLITVITRYRGLDRSESGTAAASPPGWMDTAAEEEGNVDYELLGVGAQAAAGYGVACRSASLDVTEFADPPGVFRLSFADVHANRTRLNTYWLKGADERRLPAAAARDLFTVLADSGARVYSKNGVILFTRIPLGADGGGPVLVGEGLEKVPGCLTLATPNGREVVTAALEYILAEVFIQDVFKLSLEFLTCFHPVVLAAESRLGRGSLFMLREVASSRREFTDRELRYVYDLLPELREAIGVFRT